MNAVRTLALLLALVTITLTLLLAGATGLGLLLERLLPGVGLGTGVLIGVVALSVSARFVLGLFAQSIAVREELDEAELEDLVAAMHRPARRRRSRR
jgi:hypothetical protein